jgi:drug/metabolite transporter (DMT)-like permease
LGALYFAISHGLLHWAETFVPSGLAALLISSEVIWIALMAAVVSRDERLTTKTVLGLIVGIAGVGLLTRAEAAPENGRLVFGCIAVLVSAVAWAFGVIYNRSRALPSDPVARAGMAAMSGAAQLLVVAIATGELRHAHVAAFSARSIWSLVYLITFGSILAFTTYTWLLDHC